MSGKEQIIETEALPVNIIEGATYSINQANPNSYTHGMFKYPCKFIPEIPRWAIKKYLGEKNKGVILDPFAGSGTTAVESVVNGFDAKCLEIDDIAKLIIKVKTAHYTMEEFESLETIFKGAICYLDNLGSAYVIPEINNINHWFSEITIKELGKLNTFIANIENENIRDFFKVCLISIIKKVSYADDTSPKPYVSGKIKKIPPTVKQEFLNTFKKYKKMLEGLLCIEKLGVCQVLEGDAKQFELKNKVDIAITSPPYINAFDYGRTMRLENLWMGMLTEDELRVKKKLYVGTEKINSKEESKDIDILNKSDLLNIYYHKIITKDEKRALIVKKFFEDMETNLIQVSNGLKKYGRYMVVIGNSSIRKIEVESWKVIAELSENLGYTVETFYNYVIKNPYIRIPRQGQGGKISKDYVLVLRKEK